MKYHLTVFGDCHLAQSDHNLLRIPAQAALMLAYLYGCERPVSRQELAKLLWPQAAQSAALTNLRSMLRRFAAQMPTKTINFLNIDDRYLQITRGKLDCDLDLLDQPASMERLSDLSEALHKGFLPAFGTGGTDLDKWVRTYQTGLFDVLRGDFLKICESREFWENRQQLKHVAAFLLEQDPHDEEVRNHLAKLTAAPTSPAPKTSKIHSFIELPQKPAKVPASPQSDESIAGGPAGQETNTHLSPEASTNSAPPPRIALLPPGSFGDEPQQSNIANALIEDITISLCGERDISVVAPYTSQKIATSDDKASLLEKHKVVFALDTRKTNDELFAQLVFMPSDETIWAHRFQLDAGNSADQRSLIQDAIQASIAKQITMHSPYLNEFNSNPEAYYAYLHGLQNLSSMTLPALRRARKHFKDSLKHQSNFAPALAGIARTLSMEWVLTARGDDELLAEAERLARKAIDQDQASAGAFKELGVSQLYMGRIDDSLGSLHQAENLSPHYADVLCSYADSLTHGGTPALAIEKINAAISFNPLAPDTYLWTAAGASYFIGEYQQALDHIKKMKDSSSAFRLAAACWGMLGQTSKARSCRQRVLKDNPDFDLESWLAMIPIKEKWQIEHYREGLLKAGF